MKNKEGEDPLLIWLIIFLVLWILLTPRLNAKKIPRFDSSIQSSQAENLSI